MSLPCHGWEEFSQEKLGLPVVPCGAWGCFAPWEQQASEPGGCGMLSFREWGGFAAGMGPHRHVTMERRVLSGPCTDTDPPVMCLGLCRGVVRGERRSCSYMSNVGCKRRKRKSPSGSFHQQFTAMTTVPIPSLCSSSLCIPHVLLTRSVTSAASPNKTLQ